jgi:hypothetical protein
VVTRSPNSSATGASRNSFGVDPTTLRLRLLRNGYRPVPITAPTYRHEDVRSPGKQPFFKDWRNVCAAPTEEIVEGWSKDIHNHPNTGLLCNRTPGVDIDVRVPELARKLVGVARAMLGDTPLERVGMAPKTLLCYRTGTSFRKISTAEFILPGDDPTVPGYKGHRVEILAEGQQFVAYGIHPDTLALYEWLQDGPDAVPWAELPVVTEDGCRQFVVAAEAILRAAGGRTKAEIEGKAEKTATASKSGATVIDFGKAAGDDSFFTKVNRRALGAIEKWLPVIFKTARQEPGTGAWRVSSKDLGRQLEEDLSIHPTEGGRDFGTEKSVTPIDVVMEHGRAADAVQAAIWLCCQIGVNPADLGWKENAKGDPRQQHQAGTSSSDKQSKASAREGEAWPDPGSLAPPVPPAPRFPMTALPHAIAAFVTDEANRMQAPPDLLAIPALIMLAGCIGKDAVIRPKRHDDWAERACLWGMVIQPPGSMKSAAIAKATAALRHIEAGWRKEDKQKHAEWSELKADADFRLKAYEKDFEKAMKTGGYDGPPPPKPQAVDDLPEEPKPRRLVAQDVTAEKLGELMVDSRGLTLVRDELSGWVLNMSRYNAGSDRQFYLEAYSGGPGVVDRIRRGELYIPDVYVNIVGGIQPSVAKKLFSVQDGSDDGFLDRFGLLAFPDLPDEWQLVDCRPETGLRQAVNAIADKLAAADWAVTLHTDADVEAGKAKPYVRFSPAAQEIFNDWLTEHMRGMKAAADTPIIGFYSKARGLLGRLTLVIHLTAWAAGDEGDPRTVSEQSLARALAILEGYLIPMWRRVMAAFSKAPVIDGAHKIARLIITKRLDGIRVADITKLEWAGLNERADVEAAFRTLVDRDWLAEPEAGSGARGGRPSATYIVNPKVHLTFGGDHG